MSISLSRAQTSYLKHLQDRQTSTNPRVVRGTKMNLLAKTIQILFLWMPQMYNSLTQVIQEQTIKALKGNLLLKCVPRGKL